MRDPYEPPNREVIDTRAIWRAWPMRVTLPDLGPTFTMRVVGVNEGAEEQHAADGRVIVRPGVYLLTRAASVCTRGARAKSMRLPHPGNTAVVVKRASIATTFDPRTTLTASRLSLTP